MIGRGSRVRTCGPLLPKEGRSQGNQTISDYSLCVLGMEHQRVSVGVRNSGPSCGVSRFSGLRKFSSKPRAYSDRLGGKAWPARCGCCVRRSRQSSIGATSDMGQINTYDSAAEAEADRAQQKALLMALNAWDRALRRDEAGAWAICGKHGSIHTWGNGKCWALYVRCNSGQRWTWAKKKLSFCSVTQDGDNEGCLRLRHTST